MSRGFKVREMTTTPIPVKSDEVRELFGDLNANFEKIVEYVGHLEGRVALQGKEISKLQGKAKRIEGKYRGLQKLLDGTESS